MTSGIAIPAKIAYAMGMRPALPFASSRPRHPLLSRGPGLAAGTTAALGLLCTAGCSDDGDPPLPDAPMGNCPQGEVFYTGELVDWDGRGGVNDAAFTVEGEAARTDRTSPNGRFELCLSSAARTLVTVDAPAAGTYFDGVAVVELDVLRTQTIASFRSFTSMREMQFAPRLALGKAQVFVDVAGTQREVDLDAAYEAAFAFDGAAWAEGKKGRYVFFVNVDTKAATAEASMSGSHVGGKALPTVANQLTFATVVGR